MFSSVIHAPLGVLERAGAVLPVDGVDQHAHRDATLVPDAQELVRELPRQREEALCS